VLFINTQVKCKLVAQLAIKSLKINIKKQNSETLLMPIHKEQPGLNIESQWFEPEFWKRQEKIVGESKGRFTTWFISPSLQNKQKDWVLRHYYRGGLVAKLSKDKFIYNGLEKTRPYKELSLLIDMEAMNLPVPVCVGARVIRSGLTYSADLLMEKIDAKDLVEILSRHPIKQNLWQTIGEVISRFHQQGIFHSDLNTHNIMIDADDKVWIIDFDRCEKRTISSSWQQQNLQRLSRSFVKESAIINDFHFDQQCWQWLLDGYNHHR